MPECIALIPKSILDNFNRPGNVELPLSTCPERSRRLAPLHTRPERSRRLVLSEVEGSTQTCPNSFKHFLRIIQNFIIPETNYGKTIFFKQPGSFLIIFFIFWKLMLPSIQLYDQFTFVTIKVQDIFIKCMLPSEFFPIQLPVTEVAVFISSGLCRNEKLSSTR